jgi:hypothetical protein
MVKIIRFSIFGFQFVAKNIKKRWLKIICNSYVWFIARFG